MLAALYFNNVQFQHCLIASWLAAMNNHPITPCTDLPLTPRLTKNIFLHFQKYASILFFWHYFDIQNSPEFIIFGN